MNKINFGRLRGLRRFTNDTGDETIASTEHDKKKIGINRCTLKLLNRD